MSRIPHMVVLGLVLGLASTIPTGIASADGLAPPDLDQVHQRLESLKRQAPKDVASWIERTEFCLHLGGEEPYDRERAEEIATLARQSKCHALSTDMKTLQRRYARNKRVISILREAEELRHQMLD